MRVRCCGVAKWELRLEPHVLPVRELWQLKRNTVWLSVVVVVVRDQSWLDEKTKKYGRMVSGGELHYWPERRDRGLVQYVRQPGGHGVTQGSVKRGFHGHGEVRRYLQFPFWHRGVYRKEQENIQEA
jgi:hypothetical protein